MGITALRCAAYLTTNLAADRRSVLIDVPHPHLQIRVGHPHRGYAEEGAGESAQEPGALMQPQQLGEAIDGHGDDQQEIDLEGERTETVAQQSISYPGQENGEVDSHIPLAEGDLVAEGRVGDGAVYQAEEAASPGEGADLIEGVDRLGAADEPGSLGQLEAGQTVDKVDETGRAIDKAFDEVDAIRVKALEKVKAEQPLTTAERYLVNKKEKTLAK